MGDPNHLEVLGWSSKWLCVGMVLGVCMANCRFIGSWLWFGTNYRVVVTCSNGGASNIYVFSRIPKQTSGSARAIHYINEWSFWQYFCKNLWSTIPYCFLRVIFVAFYHGIHHQFGRRSLSFFQAPNKQNPSSRGLRSLNIPDDAVPTLDRDILPPT